MHVPAVPGLALHLGVARQVRERVWQAAHVQLTEATLDTDTTVHTLFGNQMGGGKKPEEQREEEL